MKGWSFKEKVLEWGNIIMRINLIIKDFIVSKTKILIYIALCTAAFILIISNVGDNTMIQSIAAVLMNIFMAYFLTIIVFAGSNNSGDEMLIIAIPYNRREIVISRYMCIIFLDLIYTVFQGISLILLNKAAEKAGPGFLIEGVVLSFIAGIIAISILVPVFLKFTYTRASQFLALLIMVMSFSIGMFGKYVPELLADKVKVLNISTSSICIIGIAFFLFSVMLSIMIYNKKEFA